MIRQKGWTRKKNHVSPASRLGPNWVFLEKKQKKPASMQISKKASKSLPDGTDWHWILRLCKWIQWNPESEKDVKYMQTRSTNCKSQARSIPMAHPSRQSSKFWPWPHRHVPFRAGAWCAKIAATKNTSKSYVSQNCLNALIVSQAKLCSPDLDASRIWQSVSCI